jgi:hypothetical protein
MNKLAIALAVTAAILAVIIINMDLSTIGLASGPDDNTALLSLTSSDSSAAVAHAATPDPTMSPTRTPLDIDREWYTKEEIIGAFGPAPTPLPGNDTTTVRVESGGKAYPYPNGSIAYYTDYAGARDPTTEQIIAFLTTDDMYKQHTLSDGKFVCVNFAVMLHDRAESCGIRTYLASVLFTSGPSSSTGHMINAFNTTDAGWVYVDASDNGWILIGPLREGDKYRGTFMKSQDGKWGFFRTETGNIVGSVETI